MPKVGKRGSEETPGDVLSKEGNPNPEEVGGGEFEKGVLEKVFDGGGGPEGNGDGAGPEGAEEEKGELPVNPVSVFPDGPVGKDDAGGGGPEGIPRGGPEGGPGAGGPEGIPRGGPEGIPGGGPEGIPGPEGGALSSEFPTGRNPLFPDGGGGRDWMKGAEMM